MTTVFGIAAVDKLGAIGMNGQVPWKSREDMHHFRDTTMNETCVMGRKTWESIGKPLAGRCNIILSRSKDVIALPEECALVNTPRAAINFANMLGTDLYIIGGAQVYDLFSTEIDRWIVTYMPFTVDGADTFLPGDVLEDFNEISAHEIADGVVVKTYERN